MAMQAVAASCQSVGRHPQFSSENEAPRKELAHSGHHGLKFVQFCSARGRSSNGSSGRSRTIRAAASGTEVPTAGTSSRTSDRSEITKADVVVIGAGIGGLCCAALLAKYGYKVVVYESHDIAGGAGHAFERQGFQFDSGPSFHAGLSIKPSINPLKQQRRQETGEKRERNGGWGFEGSNGGAQSCPSFIFRPRKTLPRLHHLGPKIWHQNTAT